MTSELFLHSVCAPAYQCVLTNEILLTLAPGSMSLLKEALRSKGLNIFSLKVRSRKESLKLICRELSAGVKILAGVYFLLEQVLHKVSRVLSTFPDRKKKWRPKLG